MLIKRVGQGEIINGKAVDHLDLQGVPRQCCGTHCTCIGDDRVTHRLVSKLPDGGYFGSRDPVLGLAIQFPQGGDVTTVIIHVLGGCIAQPVRDCRVQLFDT
ncbi:hypothetical protein D3C87_1493490 [compost metagenome]